MESPKPNKKQSPVQRKESRRRPTHHNKRFYNSKAWRGLRQNYINDLIKHQSQAIPLTSIPKQSQAYLLNKLPICEKCYKLFIYGARTKVETGIELDHINPINPKDASNSHDGLYGNSLDMDNLQLLCRTHHIKKTNSEQRKMKLRKDQAK